MATAARVALRPNNEAPRAVLADRRGTTNFVNSNITEDNAKLLRIQRLKLIGVIGDRARLLSDLAWDADHG